MGEMDLLGSSMITRRLKDEGKGENEHRKTVMSI